ncbi:MAG: YdeI/OmpD-associated family protein [Flavobacteriales bacterium]|nr:YdeI/OmpD-associated family protein [Flavobacteriales bacterium]
MAKLTVPIQETDVHVFATAGEWHAWLIKHHDKNTGVWLRIGKKNSGLITIRYDDAVETALCHGWIDAIRRSYDVRSFVQRFTPRKARSIWSQVNRNRVIALIEAGAMTPAGLAAVKVAKANGEWDRAYSPGSTIAEPKDLLAALRKNPRAQAFYKTLNAQNRYAILHRLEKTAKPETRAKRLAQFVEMLERKEVFHP